MRWSARQINRSRGGTITSPSVRDRPGGLRGSHEVRLGEVDAMGLVQFEAPEKKRGIQRSDGRGAIAERTSRPPRRLVRRRTTRVRIRPQSFESQILLDKLGVEITDTRTVFGQDASRASWSSYMLLAVGDDSGAILRVWTLHSGI